LEKVRKLSNHKKNRPSKNFNYKTRFPIVGAVLVLYSKIKSYYLFPNRQASQNLCDKRDTAIYDTNYVSM
jgi:hypothetical protein